MYGLIVVLGNFDLRMSSPYCQQWIELLTFYGTATNGVMGKDQWMVLEVPLRNKFTEM